MNDVVCDMCGAEPASCKIGSLPKGWYCAYVFVGIDENDVAQTVRQLACSEECKNLFWRKVHD